MAALPPRSATIPIRANMPYLYGKKYGRPSVDCTTLLYHILVPRYLRCKQQPHRNGPFWSRLNRFSFCIYKLVDQSSIVVLQTSQYIQLLRFCDFNSSPIHRNIRITRVNDLIRVVTLHAAVMASCSLTYLVGCSIAPNDSYQVRYL